MKAFTLTIDGMSCGGCVRRVTGALEAKDVSIKRVDVGTAEGSFDEAAVDLDDVVAAVNALGFHVKNTVEVDASAS